MAENRHRYPCFLHVSLFLLSLILGTFGIVGYLAFGDMTCQIVTSNLNGWMAVFLQALLFVGVLCTYPLQLYPCIQIAESAYLKVLRWRLSKKKKYNLLRTPTPMYEEECLIDSDEKPPEVEKLKVCNPVPVSCMMGDLMGFVTHAVGGVYNILDFPVTEKNNWFQER